MTTYVLVHGGGHGGWCYLRVKQRLEAAGHEVFAPSLTGLAERSHLLDASVDLETHLTDVTSLLHHWDLRDVVLVGHSYGGMVITGVADRSTDRVGKLVYLDAANPKNNMSLVDVAGPTLELARPFGETRDGIELVLLPAEGAGAFYGVEDPDDLAWMDERLTAQPWSCFAQKLVLANEEELWALPQYHIVCEANLLSRDQALIGRARDEGRLWTIDTGHDLMITEPDFVTQALLEIGEDPAT